MPVDLPLPAPPEPVVLAPVRRDLGQQLDVQVQGRLLRLQLPADVDVDELRHSLLQSASAEDALRRLPYLMVAAGYLSVRTYYLEQADGSLQVWLIPVALTAVDGEAPMLDYFQPLADSRRPLRAADLEPRRTLAGLHADRAGLRAGARLLPDGEDLRMDLHSYAQGDRGKVRVAVGNPGNRYVGRRFVDLDVRMDSVSGAEFGLFWRESDRLFQGSNADYHEQGLSASLFRPQGLFSLGARRFDYRVRDPAGLLDGEQDYYELSWLAVPKANFRVRWTTELKLDLTQQSLFRNSDEQLLRQERYPSLSVTLQRTATATVLGKRLDYDGSLLLRQGLGGDPTPAGASALDYRLTRLGFGARWRLLPSLALETQLAGQWSDDRLPDAQLWALGGPQLVRAYYPGAALGDRGAYARLSSLLPLPPYKSLQLTPAVHVEWGRSDRENSPDGTLADLALSLDLRYRRRWSASLSSGLPFVERGDPRLLEGARAGLFFRLAADL